jgi:hypothetical protein
MSLRGGINRRSNLFVNSIPDSDPDSDSDKEQNNNLTQRLKATASQRIKTSRKEQKEQKNNKCQPHQKFVIPAKAGIQGNALNP